MLRALPPLAQLRAFAAVVEAGSVSEAGALLNVSHAAISQQIRALEAHLGLPLVVKDGRSIRRTEAGARRGTCVTEGFSGIAREIAALTGADADRPLQITTTPMFASAWLVPRLPEIRAAHPNVDLMLNPSTKTMPLEPGGIDIAVRFGTGHWPGLDAELLVRTDFVIAASKELLADCNVGETRDLLAFPWLQEIGTTEIDDFLKDHGVMDGRVKSLTEMPGNLLLDALRAGQGVAATTMAFLEQDVARGDIVVLQEDRRRGVGYFLVHRPGVLRAPAKAFAMWIRRAARAAVAAS